MDSDLANSLFVLIDNSAAIPNEIKKHASDTRQRVELLAPLSGYTIGLYPVPNSSKAQQKAIKVRDAIRGAGFNGIIRTYKKDEKFFDRVVWPKGNEIRYKIYERE